MSTESNNEKNAARRSIDVGASANGFHTVRIDDYESFADLLGSNHFRDYPQYVFRGHRDPSYVTLPSLYRELNRKLGPEAPSSKKTDRAKSAGIETARVLRTFLYKIRGTVWQEGHHELIANWFDAYRNSHQTDDPHINELREDDKRIPGLWSAVLSTWALGQHHELHTPLLDWSHSMLVALYFAFSERDERLRGEEYREVYALNRAAVERRCRDKGFEGGRLEFVAPYMHGNPRMTAQQGLFTYSSANQSVKDWVIENFAGENDTPVMIRILIRNEHADDATRWLTRAGISDCTIYPDLTGISKFTNRAFHDDKLYF